MSTNEALNLTQAMVRVPSVNPQDRETFAEPYGETRMAAFVADWLSKHDLPVERITVSPGREMVVSVSGATGRPDWLVLCAHLDTVEIAGMTEPPFEGIIRDGRLYGRGACDTKASLAAMCIAYRDRVRQGNLPGGLVLLATCGEEHNMCGAKAFVQQYGSQVAGAVVGEPTGLRVIVAHKGVVRLRLTTRGKSAHSSNPEAGVNALYPMAEAVLAVRRYAERLRTERVHPRLDCETIAATIIRGGQQVNVLPDVCTADVDWRLLPGHEPEAARDELAAMLAEAVGDAVEVQFRNTYAPMETPADAPLVQSLLRAAEKVTGCGETGVVSYGTDAGAFANLGKPMVVCGPGDIGQAHRADEYIAVDAPARAVAVYANLLNGPWPWTALK